MSRKERAALGLLLFAAVGATAVVMTSLAVVLMASRVSELVDGLSK